MRRLIIILLFGGVVLFTFPSKSWSQEVQSKNSKSWKLSGRIQLQYLLDTNIDGDAARTNNGFRMRRGRFQAEGKITEWVDAKFEFEIRDNSPRLKDAEGKIKLGKKLFVRLGQFKVPVWREQMRSSGKLLLVERSAADAFLFDLNLSARQIGLEIGGKTQNGIHWAFNVSNGAGEGNREDAGRGKSSGFVNNGKLFTGRANVPVGDKLQVSLSGAVNRVGAKIGTTDNSGTIYTIAPDFRLYLPAGNRGHLEIEGGMAFGGISRDFAGTTDDVNFVLFDVTGRWSSKLSQRNQKLGGLDAVEFAAGLTYVEPNTDSSDDETLFFRFGPAVYFGKQTRVQVNGEIESPAAPGADTIFKLRTQATFNF
jgi:hypothetical protein